MAGHRRAHDCCLGAPIIPIRVLHGQSFSERAWLLCRSLAAASSSLVSRLLILRKVCATVAATSAKITTVVGIAIPATKLGRVEAVLAMAREGGGDGIGGGGTDDAIAGTESIMMPASGPLEADRKAVALVELDRVVKRTVVMAVAIISVSASMFTVITTDPAVTVTVTLSTGTPRSVAKRRRMATVTVAEKSVGEPLAVRDTVTTVGAALGGVITPPALGWSGIAMLQSVQSVPVAQLVNSAPGPPSSQSPSLP